MYSLPSPKRLNYTKGLSYTKELRIAFQNNTLDNVTAVLTLTSSVTRNIASVTRNIAVKYVWDCIEEFKGSHAILGQ